MRFLNKRNEYNVTYSKSEAAKELQQDPRVESVERYYNGIIINTIPVIPYYDKKNTNLKYRRNFYLCPIGSYKIYIIKKGASFVIWPVRNEGPFKKYNYHYHIRIPVHSDFSMFSENKDRLANVCWGNMSNNLAHIEGAMDWYWAGKVAIDLLYDGNPEHALDIECMFYEIQLAAQHDYAMKVLKDTKIILELDRRYHKLLNTILDNNSRSFRSTDTRMSEI